MEAIQVCASSGAVWAISPWRHRRTPCYCGVRLSRNQKGTARNASYHHDLFTSIDHSPSSNSGSVLVRCVWEDSTSKPENSSSIPDSSFTYYTDIRPGLPGPKRGLLYAGHRLFRNAARFTTTCRKQNTDNRRAWSRDCHPGQPKQVFPGPVYPSGNQWPPEVRAGGQQGGECTQEHHGAVKHPAANKRVSIA